jgi:Metallo-peptidase family M12B Reprolysin-like
MGQTYPFQLRDREEAAREIESQLHPFGDGIICDTDTKGYAEPGNRSPLELAVDATQGFIPLWERGVTLRWRFQEHSMSIFADPDAAKAEIKALLGESLVKWGDSAPVRFTQQDDAWDFEVAVMEGDQCTPTGCVLARAFFPDAGRHDLVLFPKMFTQSRKEQVDTFIHEFGHTFGLRHFFANISETRWRSEIFGTHKPFSIMNYGSQSELSDDDKSDLKRLYQMVWSGELTEINGTPIRFMQPFHTAGVLPVSSVASEHVHAVGESVTPRVSRRAGTASSADYHSGIAPATGDKQPGLPADPPRRPTGDTEVTP